MFKKLPDLELEVMQAVWICKEPVLRRDIEKTLKSTNQLAPTTILTVLTRLKEKGFVSLEKVGNKLWVHAVVSQTQYQTEQGKYYFNKICKGNIFTLGNALCDAGLNKSELQELAELIRKLSDGK